MVLGYAWFWKSRSPLPASVYNALILYKCFIILSCQSNEFSAFSMSLQIVECFTISPSWSIKHQENGSLIGKNLQDQDTTTITDQ